MNDEMKAASRKALEMALSQIEADGVDTSMIDVSVTTYDVDDRGEEIKENYTTIKVEVIGFADGSADIESIVRNSHKYIAGESLGMTTDEL